ncbi:MFS transporter [Spirulina sp. CCNP1310]|uniref:MFS transporter n=1 Tax=Spirulina sp. CCNP1310 TaxID=3110249 RepID=UPI002B20B6EC|nr:MFS transporter [Spirulina sp. CCNP1310]MEA5418701.1 MFS transporter [Spirulina sp. CCNP1310]
MNRSVWVLAAGRLLSQIGTGFTLFYAAIFFVNEVGLTATAVGFALGSQSLSGIVGRFLGGMGADSPRWGRRGILLLSALISALADVAFALAHNLPTLVLGNLLMGLGVGLYWPAAEAAVADLANPVQRNEAFALTRLADLLGLGIGTVVAGQWIAWGGNYRNLFVGDGISFLLFMVLIYWTIPETRSPQTPSTNFAQGWLHAFGDRTFMIYCAVNILFTTYISQIQSALPLYFTNFLRSGGFNPAELSGLMTFHLALAVLLQLPIARWLKGFSRWHVLMFSLLLWGGGFVAVWRTGVVATGAMIPALIALSLFALGTVTYTPAASALVVDLAPESLRGIYFSLNSQCWAVGYLIGPAVGGWAMDQEPGIVDQYWWLLALGSLGGFGVLWLLWSAVQRQQRQIKALVMAAAQACMAQDAAAFAALFTSGGEVVLKGQKIQGREAIAQVTAAYFATCGEIAIALEEITLQHNRAEIRWHWHSDKGDGYTVTNRHNHIILDIENGKIHRWQEDPPA